MEEGEVRPVFFLKKCKSIWSCLLLDNGLKSRSSFRGSLCMYVLKKRAIRSWTVGEQGRTHEGFWGLNPPLSLIFYEVFITCAEDWLLSHAFCLWICRHNANTTEWIRMQISRNIVKGQKTNNQVMVGIWVIICIHTPSHHFWQTFRPHTHV